MGGKGRGGKGRGRDEPPLSKSWIRHWEWLEQETSNLACRFRVRGINERNVKLGQRGPEKSHVTYF